MVPVTVQRAQCWGERGGRVELGHLPLTFEELEIKKCTGNCKSMWTGSGVEEDTGSGAPWEERWWPGAPDWSGVRAWPLCPDRPKRGGI